ncbi:MAG: amidase [Myxococcales bacterium]|nr:amidase [Myxococcales bacterium]
MRVLPIALDADAHPLLSLDATELAAQIADGAVRSRELVELALARIEAHNPAVQALVHVDAEGARRSADAMDALRAKGHRVGPFHGVPTAVKDLHWMRGAPMRLGSRAFSWMSWAPFDDMVVRSLRRGGFVLLGKTSTSELGLLPIVETDLHPPTRNPWDLTRLAGGSSGGAGAALAAGLVPIAPGSDGAGSIRIPAALNGMLGLKPSRWLVPDGNDRLDVHRMSTCGPLGRSVDDVAGLLDVMADPRRAAPGGYLAASKRPTKALNVGVYTEPPFGATDPGLVRCVREAAEALRAAGHSVTYRERLDGSLEEFIPLYQAFFARLPVLLPGRLQPVSRWFRQRGKALDARKIAEQFESLAARARASLDGVDVLLTPATACLAPAVGSFAALEPEALFHAIAPLGAFTAAANLSGYPALAVPFGRVGVLPGAVQLVARPGEDGRLLALARTLLGEALAG